MAEIQVLPPPQTRLCTPLGVVYIEGWISGFREESVITMFRVNTEDNSGWIVDEERAAVTALSSSGSSYGLASSSYSDVWA